MDRNLVSRNWTLNTSSYKLLVKLFKTLVLSHSCLQKVRRSTTKFPTLPTGEKPHVRTSFTQSVSFSSRTSGALTELGFTWFPRDKLRGWAWNPQMFTCTVSTAQIFLLPPTFRAAWEVPSSNGSCTAAAGAQLSRTEVTVPRNGDVLWELPAFINVCKRRLSDLQQPNSSELFSLGSFQLSVLAGFKFTAPILWI